MSTAGAVARAYEGGLGVRPLELDILQKLYYKGSV